MIHPNQSPSHGQIQVLWACEVALVIDDEKPHQWYVLIPYSRRDGAIAWHSHQISPSTREPHTSRLALKSKIIIKVSNQFTTNDYKANSGPISLYPRLFQRLFHQQGTISVSYSYPG